MIPPLPRAVVCDMDGLLVDSERTELRVWRQAAAAHGVELSDDRFRTFVGLSADQSDRLLVDYYGADFDIEAFRATCGAHMHAIVETEGIPLRRGAREWLHFVSGLRIPLGLATSSAAVHVPTRMADLLELFSVVVTRGDVDRGKPHPDIYLEAAARLGMEPAGCLAVEDSPAGARAALAAGMPVVVVPDLVHPPEDLAGRVSAIYPSLDALRSAAVLAWLPSPRPVRADG